MVIPTTGVGSREARGAAAPLNAGCRGLHPPTNLRQWVSEAWCEIKLPAIIHSGMAQNCSKSFFVLAPQQTATAVQDKVALPCSWQIARHVEVWLVSYYCTRIDLKTSVFQKFSSGGGGMPPDPPSQFGLRPHICTSRKTLSRPGPLIKNIFLRCCALAFVLYARKE